MECYFLRLVANLEDLVILREPFSVLGSEAQSLRTIKVEAFIDEFREGRGI